MSGLQRYASNVLAQIDQIIGTRKDEGLDVLDIVFVSPGDCDTYPSFRNIPIRKIGFKCHQGTFAFKIFNRLWNYVVYPSFRATHAGFGVDLAQAFPTFGLDLIAIHDCIRETYYEGDTGHFQKSYLWKIKRYTSNPRNYFVTVSENSRRDLIGFYNIPEDKIFVVGNGWEHMMDVQPDADVLAKFNLSEESKFCFSLGSGHKHKNMDWVVNVARVNPDYTFLISGGDISDRYPDFPGNIKNTGHLTDAEIKGLYQHCSAFL